MLKIKVLKANKGDCFIIEYGEIDNQHYIVVDSGMGRVCFRQLKMFIDDIVSNNKTIDLMILSHYDKDHINGFLHLVKYKMINSKIINWFWMNYGIELSKKVRKSNILTFSVNESTCDTSATQGKELCKFITENGIEFNHYIVSGQKYSFENINIEILSPSIKQLEQLLEEIKYKSDYLKIDSSSDNLCETAGTEKDFSYSVDDLISHKFVEDASVSNCSSIAFLFEYKSYKILMLGDSAPSQIVNSLKSMGYSKESKLKLSCCKVSHHGSNHNTSDELIEMLDCQNYIISSDWNSTRPSKECLSRIVSFSEKPVTFLCNYNPKVMFTQQELDKYNISFKYLNNTEFVLEE